ncbi:Uncharacterised protein [Escherichia coli]|uniref:Uncharacterized protein n=1 Tax=Escherichia coli TaxID=562 RepID=A0A376VG69_ECOLX|nr:Uncharacterised protein [Escherichia coli]
MALKQPLDASELRRYRHISSKNMVFLRNHRFLQPRPRIFLISFINGGLKGLIRVICNRCLILSTDDGHVAKYGNASRLWILLVAIILTLVWLVR